MIDAPSMFTVSCPSCRSEFPIDPDRIPAEGIHAICSSCMRVFLVEVPADLASEAPGSTDSSWESILDDDFLESVDDGGDTATAVTSPPEVEVVTPSEAPAQPEVDEVVEDESGVVVEDEVTEDAVDEAAAGVVEDVVEEPPAEVEEPPAPAAKEDKGPLEDLSTVMSEALDDDDAVSKSALSLGAAKFGNRDPNERAKRLARRRLGGTTATTSSRRSEPRSWP